MIKSLLSNNSVVKDLYKQPIKELDYPHITVPEEGWFEEIDILHLPSDKGYKYALNVVDVYNSSCDGIPLKSKEMKNLCHELLQMYENSLYLKFPPKVLQGDQAFNNKYFKDFCEEHGITYKFTITNRHRQNEEEIKTGRTCRKWVDVYPKLIKILNSHHKNKKLKEPSNEIIINKNNKKIIMPGTQVRLMIPTDEPQNLKGEKLFGKVRAGDPKWRQKPTYTVVAPVLIPNNPPLYQIRNNRTNRVVDAHYTYEQLQVIN